MGASAARAAGSENLRFDDVGRIVLFSSKTDAFLLPFDTPACSFASEATEAYGAGSGGGDAHVYQQIRPPSLTWRIAQVHLEPLNCPAAAMYE